MVDNKNIFFKLVEHSDPEQALMNRTKISVKEAGVHYIATVNPPRDTAVFQIDGNIIKDGWKCDKLILSSVDDMNGLWNGHFIELKGQNISHAIEQLEATLKHDLFKRDMSLKQRFARVVGSSFPSNAGNPLIEKAKIRFKKNYQCELKMLKSNQPDKI